MSQQQEAIKIPVPRERYECINTRNIYCKEDILNERTNKPIIKIINRIVEKGWRHKKKKNKTEESKRRREREPHSHTASSQVLVL